jgi:hypothetical protein
MRTVGFVATAMAGAAAIIAALTVAVSIGDVRRYLNIRKM